MATAAKGKLATLETLYLDNNPFGEAGAEILGVAIASGTLPAMSAMVVPNVHKNNAKLLATGFLYSGSGRQLVRHSLPAPPDQ